MPLGERTVIKIGDVALWFLAEVVHEPVTPPSMATATAGGGLVRYNLAPGTIELCLVATQRRHPDDTSLVAVGPVAAEWLTIAQAFAGPPGVGRAPSGAGA